MAGLSRVCLPSPDAKALGLVARLTSDGAGRATSGWVVGEGVSGMAGQLFADLTAGRHMSVRARLPFGRDVTSCRLLAAITAPFIGIGLTALITLLPRAGRAHDYHLQEVSDAR